MKNCLLAVIAIASVLFFAGPIGATSWSTDQSDLYGDPNESGWGAQFVQRGSVLVVTIYVYNTTNTAIWYNAALAATATSSVWQGDLYEYRGPWLGAVPFDPSAVQSRKVGTMTWQSQSMDGGMLTYTVDGVTVTKNIKRFTFAVDDFSGTYVGALSGTATGCTNPSGIGTAEGVIAIAVLQNGSNITLRLAYPDGSACTLSGVLTQSGQFGKAAGTMTCEAGDSGTFQISEMIVGVGYLAGRIVVNDNSSCRNDGTFAAVRNLP